MRKTGAEDFQAPSQVTSNIFSTVPLLGVLVDNSLKRRSLGLGFLSDSLCSLPAGIPSGLCLEATVPSSGKKTLFWYFCVCFTLSISVCFFLFYPEFFVCFTPDFCVLAILGFCVFYLFWFFVLYLFWFCQLCLFWFFPLYLFWFLCVLFFLTVVLLILSFFVFCFSSAAR